eukprot:10355335-Lingulodinium_polyedra.AAC.1
MSKQPPTKVWACTHNNRQNSDGRALKQAPPMQEPQTNHSPSLNCREPKVTKGEPPQVGDLSLSCTVAKGASDICPA